MNKVVVLIGLLSLGGYISAQEIKMVEIPAGVFTMGSDGRGEDYDEAPAHLVTISRPFRMSVTEITNAQYEEYDPSHREMRGYERGLSIGDNEAVTMVSYYDAEAFCCWLSEKTGRHYRLPTEAEWEYSCRAGTKTEYWTGDTLSFPFQKNQKTERNLVKVSLAVDDSPANPFGLHGMHGNVEEWCIDWYAGYEDAHQTDPSGPESGLYKVTRGGSHNTPSHYLRSANRSAALPADKHSQIGFRIVESDTEIKVSGIPERIPLNMSDVSDSKYRWKKVSSKRPVFLSPIPFVHKPDDGTPFYSHNHQPALTWCSNGDLLAVWFSCDNENGREQVVLGSRLRKGHDEWDKASLFLRIADRNLTGSSLLTEQDGKILHFNGIANSGDWQNLALSMRSSNDNGCTWSQLKLIEPKHTKRHQVVAGPIITNEGWIVQSCDAGPGGGPEGTSVHISKDGGETWIDPWDGRKMPSSITDGMSGPSIAGIHGAVVQLRNGDLMAVGRGVGIKGDDGKLHLPQSFSSDGGHTWTYRAMEEFLPIYSGQRVTMRRLAEGPIMLVSFTGHPQKGERFGMEFVDSEGKSYLGQGMFVALSFDEGKTWPVRKLVTDGVRREMDGGAWTGTFTMDATHSEPRGYLACVQTPDRMIHLISSRNHYRFNLAWIMDGVAPQK